MLTQPDDAYDTAITGKKRIDRLKTDLITFKIQDISEVGLVRQILCKSPINAYTDIPD
jgi:hypothetical protein